MTTPDSSPVRPSADPLQGLTLEALLTRLVTLYGWPEMARFVKIRCFSQDPSIKSSLTFLRRTPWARAEVEALYRRFGHEDWLAHERERAETGKPDDTTSR